MIAVFYANNTHIKTPTLPCDLIFHRQKLILQYVWKFIIQLHYIEKHVTHDKYEMINLNELLSLLLFSIFSFIICTYLFHKIVFNIGQWFKVWYSNKTVRKQSKKKLSKTFYSFEGKMNTEYQRIKRVVIKVLVTGSFLFEREIWLEILKKLLVFLNNYEKFGNFLRVWWRMSKYKFWFQQIDF